MAVDTPAKIAIIGAGPVGLEAAVYARYLGYDVDLYERGRAAEELRCAGSVRSLEPWNACTTPLGRASLANQDSQWRPADDDAVLSCGELVDRYFAPLAACDLLADCLQPGTTVEAVGREAVLRTEFLQDARRIDVPFRLIVRDADGARRVEHADVVFDCTGLSVPSNIGSGGLPALGEEESRKQIDHAPIDLLGARKADFVGKRTLVVGDGYEAAQAIVDLARLAAEDAQTRIVWATHGMSDDHATGRTTTYSDDPLAERAALSRRADELAAQSGGILDFWPATHVEAMEYREDDGQFQVELTGRHAGHELFDRVVEAVGPRPDVSLWREMQLLVCPATEAPLPMAEFLRRQAVEPSQDATTVRRALAQALLNPEPDFYVLGSKSYGRRGDFALSHGHEQIVALFTVIGDREGLDLYASRFATS